MRGSGRIYRNKQIHGVEVWEFVRCWNWSSWVPWGLGPALRNVCWSQRTLFTISLDRSSFVFLKPVSFSFYRRARVGSGAETGARTCACARAHGRKYTRSRACARTCWHACAHVRGRMRALAFTSTRARTRRRARGHVLTRARAQARRRAQARARGREQACTRA